MIEQKPLWKPTSARVGEANITRFANRVAANQNIEIKSYEDLYRFSTEHSSEFWKELWDFVGIRTSTPFTQVVDDIEKLPGARWFLNAKMNFAENLLRFHDDRTAIVSILEDGSIREISYKELRLLTQKMAMYLKVLGVKKGDRVASFLPNTWETVVAMLGTTALGAVWSSSSPDFGIQGVFDRFSQIQPKVLFATSSYLFKGKRIDCKEKVDQIKERIPSIEKVILVDLKTKDGIAGNSHETLRNHEVSFDDILKSTNVLGIDEFEQISFDDPVYIMYSSGTTGLPKCMVQGPGVLVNHLKELVLHTDLTRDDTIFYFTTCGWMMWNWLISSLAVGARIVLFDGNPFYPRPDILFEYAEKYRFSIFGTSARYISALQSEGCVPKKKFDLSALKTILSTGSPLSPDGFRFVYDSIKEDLQLSSISGGTDLNGCFALGCPSLPVYEGEIQCRGLGMSVEIWDESGQAVVGEKGELVCTKAFPSMPLYFYADDGSKYHKAYFDVYPGVWRHGDFAEITERNGIIIYGRSDATLNPGGVRIGTAEIYRVLETLEEIEDSVIIGQDWKDDVRVVLFIKLYKGYEVTPDGLFKRIKDAIRVGASPRHVPAKILLVNEIPYTINMKKVEIAVRKTVQGEEVTNKDALLNPNCLEEYRNRPELAED